MNIKSLSPPRMMLAVLCAMALLMCIVVTPARADLFDKKTILTVNQTIQVRDTVLEPGQYVLKLYDSQCDRHIVQIFNRDQTHIINTVLAIPRERMNPADNSEFTFWETPQGTNRALRTWFYPGDTVGQEFPYPKHLQQVAMVTTPASAAVPFAAAEPAASNAETAPAESPAQSEAAAPEPSSEPATEPQSEPAEIAQNTAPVPEQTPPPAEPQTQTTPEKPAELPKTGSPYPAIGISGIMLLGLAGLLRLRRQA